MLTRRAAVPALALALALTGAGFGAAGPAPAYAQASPAAPPAHAQAHPEHQHFDPTRFVDGRIAFLRAELKITPAQAPQFDKVAQAMRENAQDMKQRFEQMRANRDKPKNAVERLEMRQRFAQMHVQHSERFLAAFRPLYASLSPEQKQMADELLAGHHHHGRGHGHG
ncbi:MAG TPA: Spy/CpxP family protein refolding chaperone [Stellaceae bacterium]|jgi:hypothetical protein|nr:Spy/CpxP family protein refolding chaperone [Stellaceae bacterium]